MWTTPHKQRSDHLISRKVVFVNRYFYPDHSATSQMLSDLAFGLAKAGENVEIVTSRQRYDDPGSQLPSLECISTVHIHRIWTSRFGRENLVGRSIDYITFYMSAAWKIWQRTDANTILVVKTDPPLISIVGALVARLRGAMFVTWLQDLFPEVASALGVRTMRGRAFSLLQYLRNRSLHFASINVVIGTRMKEFVGAQGISTDKLQLIPNWADTSIKPVTHTNNFLRTRWSLSDKLVVGYSGNLSLIHI